MDEVFGKGTGPDRTGHRPGRPVAGAGAARDRSGKITFVIPNDPVLATHRPLGRGPGLAYLSSWRRRVMKAWPAGVPTPVMLS
jgi:hypothetical protein